MFLQNKSKLRKSDFGENLGQLTSRELGLLLQRHQRADFSGRPGNGEKQFSEMDTLVRIRQRVEIQRQIFVRRVGNYANGGARNSAFRTDGLNRR